MTLFSFEVPIAHLEDFSEYQDFHFALSMLCRTSKKYLEFYQSKVEQTLKVVWLDNSFNEKMKADDPFLLVRTAQKLRPHLIFGPDSPKWPITRIQEAFEATRNLLKNVLPQTSIAVVVKDQAMKAHLENRGARNFAVSHWIPERVQSNHDAVQWARSCHFLGMNSPQELWELQPPSCDTTLPIKLAMQGKTLRGWWEEGCPYTHDSNPVEQRRRKKEYFNLHFDDKTLELAINNIKALKEVCNAYDPKR